MRKLILVPVLASLAACGSSGKSGGAPSGNVGGRAFTAADQKAIVVATTTPCSIPVPGTTTPLEAGVAALGIELTSYGNACGDFSSSQCVLHQNAQTLTIILAKLDLSGNKPTLSTGTYNITAADDPRPTVGMDGTWSLALGFAHSTDGSCASTHSTPSPSIATGRLTVNSLTSPVTGHVQIAFSNGDAFESDFSAPLCSGVDLDVCSLAVAHSTCTGAPTCVQ